MDYGQIARFQSSEFDSTIHGSCQTRRYAFKGTSYKVISRTKSISLVPIKRSNSWPPITWRKAVDQTLTNSNRDLLERWLIQIETGRERLVEVLLRRCPLAMAARFLEQLESDRVDVVAAALEGGAIERYLDQMEAGNTQVIIWYLTLKRFTPMI